MTSEVNCNHTGLAPVQFRRVSSTMLDYILPVWPWSHRIRSTDYLANVTDQMY